MDAMSAVLALSLAANVTLGVVVRRLLKSPPPQKTIDAAQILHDLTWGSTLVTVTRVDPDDVLLRSPKGRG